MCKELPVILVNKVVDLKRICNWKKMEGRGGGEAQGAADPPKTDLLVGVVRFLLLNDAGLVRLELLESIS
jgi:hypothetical protein